MVSSSVGDRLVPHFVMLIQNYYHTHNIGQCWCSEF